MKLTTGTASSRFHTERKNSTKILKQLRTIDSSDSRFENSGAVEKASTVANNDLKPFKASPLSLIVEETTMTTDSLQKSQSRSVVQRGWKYCWKARKWIALLTVLAWIGVPTTKSSNGRLGSRNHHKLLSNPYVPSLTNDDKPLIPKRLIFTYKFNILDEKKPVHFYKNVVHTIEGYKSHWSNSDDVVVSFLDNQDCRKVIARSASFLLDHFEHEEKGSYRADICRLATLYEEGGYYFDVDMELIAPFVAPPDVDFATAVEGDSILQLHKYFFQSFLAASPHHPVIEKALYVVLDYYETQRHSFFPSLAWMGPYTLKKAFDEHYENATDDELRRVFLLKEVNLAKGIYDHLERHEGRGCCCNYVVQDEKAKRAYFYSRMVGAGWHCDFP